MNEPMRNSRFAAITALFTMFLSILNPRLLCVRAFQIPRGTRRTFQSSSLQSFVSRGQMTMWGEDPQGNKPAIPTTRDSRQTRPNPVVDGDGRRIRQRREDSGGDSSFDDWGNSRDSGLTRGRRSDRDSFNNDWDTPPAPSRRSNNAQSYDNWGDSNPSPSNDGWDDFDASPPRRNPRGGRGGDRGGRGGRGGRGRGGRGRGRNDRGERFDRGSKFTSRNQEQKKDAAELKTNLRALEKAGFVHLYGLAPVINALAVKKRDLVGQDSIVDIDLLHGEDLEHEKRQRERKPEAQFSPWLFVQENMQYGSGGKTGDKAVTAKQVEELARENDVPVAYVDKGVLNTLCGSRPHQVSRYRGLFIHIALWIFFGNPCS